MGTAAASGTVYEIAQARGCDSETKATDAPKRRQKLGRVRVVGVGLLITVVTILVVGALVAVSSGRLAVDARLVYMPAAKAVLHGQSPYVTSGYVYPPQLAFALTPLALLPDDIAAFVALVAVAALLIGTLAILGVRDVLCYLAVFAWAPTWQEFDMASVTAALAFALALTWRYRDRVWPSAVALGLAVPAKLFLWPVLVWTLAMRRLRLTALATAFGLGVTLSLWAALGFDGLAGYPTLVRRLNEIEARRGSSLVGVTSSLGLGETVGDVLMVVTGFALIAGCIALARKGDEERSFTLAVAAALTLTPILWLHYLVLLLVPLAIARPQFSAIWLLPMLLWANPTTPMSPTGYGKLLPALVFAAVVYRLATRPRLQSPRMHAPVLRSRVRWRVPRHRATLA